MSKPEISCNGKSCLSFHNSSNVHIENLVFTECFNEHTDGGAVFVSRAKTVNITQCLFAHNFIRNYGGGAIRLKHIENVQIQNSSFINNTASCTSFAYVLKTPCLSNCKATSGAISILNVSSLIITDCYFYQNRATCSGGAIAVANSNITLLSSRFTRSKTGIQHSLGGGLVVILCTLRVIDSIFEQNESYNNGGGIYLSESVADILKSSFLLNYAEYMGGAIFSVNTTLSIRDSLFTANKANVFGGAIHIVSVGKMTLVSSTTFHASYTLHGGALSMNLGEFINCSLPCVNELSTETHIFIIDCIFKLNIGKLTGGSIYAIGGVLEISNSEFIKSTCYQGSIHSSNNTIILQKNRFTNNICGTGLGGALYIFNGLVQSSNCKFSNNEGGKGGAVFLIYSTLVTRNDEYSGNTALETGGAVYALHSTLNTTRCTYSNNSATFGGGTVLVYRSSYTSKECTYNNSCTRQNGSALFLIASLINLNGDFIEKSYNVLREEAENQDNSTVMIALQLINAIGTCKNLTFYCNMGSVYLFFSTLTFTGSVVFTDNSGITGGALTLVQSTAYFDKSCQVLITNNSATYGGGIFLSQSELKVNTPQIIIENNTALLSGGGIFGYQSQVLINVDRLLDSVVLKRNTATEGGALFCTATILSIFSGSVIFIINQAIRGGAVTLSESSKIYLKKSARDFQNDLSIILLFSNNTAEYGGAIYVVDRSNSGVLCEQTSRNSPGQLSTNECFMQTLGLYSRASFDLDKYNYVNTFFQFNKGTQSGNDIYGGLLDRCQLNSFSEIFNIGFFKKLTGFDYLKTTAQFQIPFNYTLVSGSFNPYLLTKNITKEHMKELISSDAVQLCFCTEKTYNCSFHHPVISVPRGKPFSIRAVTVDHVENPVNGTVLANVVSRGTRLKEGQVQQFTTEMCTELTYNVFSKEAGAILEIYPDGPCSNIGISSKKITIKFLPCHCPNGLQPAPLENECKCECNTFVSTYASNCQPVNTSITVVRRTKKIWIQYGEYLNVIGFLFQSCPYDYCVNKPGNLSITLPLGVDKQCAFTRTGIMCGECEDGLSLVFSSSRCLQCSDHYIALMIVFAFAGVALVAFILIFNITVGVGTIHGLILYTNIVEANSSIFLPPETALKTFVSWVNLDLGIETCFYNGMDSSAKVLLQLVFPLYTIFLSAMIIVLSNYWGWFARLIGGRKNPVSTLCTLFLLSYSKLLRTTIASLQFTSLSYPDGSTKILWLYNPNISYFTASRIPFFVISILTITFGTVYTVLLFFGQWIRKSRNIKLLRCFHSIKYNAFIDAYNGPFVLNCRFWIGILLITRIIHHTLSSLLGESAHLLIVICLLSMLLTLKHAFKGIQKLVD